MTTNDDIPSAPSIGALTKELAGKEPAEQTEVSSIVIGQHTMARIASMITNDPNLGTVIMGIIEAGGGDPAKQWRLHLRGGLALASE